MKKIVFLIVIIFLGIIFVILINQPRHGTVKKEVTPEIKNEIGKIKQKYQNKYLSLEYEDDYDKREEGDNLWLVGKRGVSESWTLVCRQFSEALKEDSGVQMRRAKKEEYSESGIKIDGEEALFFEKKDKSERTVFVLRDGIMVTLSMTANSNDEELEKKFETVLASLKWN